MNKIAIEEKCRKIEAAFSELRIAVTKRDNTAVSNSLRIIGTSLTELFHKIFNVQLIEGRPGTNFSVMSVYPDQSMLEQVISAVSEQKPNGDIIRSLWKKCNNWTIEIDNRCFLPKYDLSPKELVALIIHEVGHTVISDSVPNRINRILQFKLAEANIGTKHVLRDGVFKKILAIPILDTCTFSTHKNKNMIRDEIKADNFAVKNGYGDSLQSALDKFISTNASTKEKDMDTVTGFMLSTLDNFEQRKAKLASTRWKDVLRKTSSPIMRDAIISFGESTIFYQESGSFTITSEDVRHSITCDRVSELVQEAFIIFKKKLKRIEPYELDYIMIEKDKMKTNDDKLLLVSYIHSKLDIVNYYISILDNPKYSEKYDVPHSKEELLFFQKRLHELREEVLNKQIEPVHYGLTISYPAGYEG